MIDVSFSLTEKVVIDPILHWRAPLPPLQSGEMRSLSVEVWQVVQSEVIARAFALFTSVFAAADSLAHLSAGLYKGSSLLARHIFSLPHSKYTRAEASAHFKQAAWFAGLTVVGSIAGVIWPGIFKYCRYAPPPPPPDDFPGDAPPHIIQLAEEVRNNRTADSIERLKQFWYRSSLSDKNWFVKVFSTDGVAPFQAVRAGLANTVYRLRAGPGVDDRVRWLATQEIHERVRHVWEQATKNQHSFFFHATSERSLEFILKSLRVEVRHEKVFKGAFVSTQPETQFGRCILAFKRSIERLSPLEHGFTSGNGYWAGFSRDIPVTESTLAFILLDRGTEEECRALEANVQQWAGRQIKVISLQDAEPYLNAVQGLDMGIPAEWVNGDPAVGQTILNIMQTRAAAAAAPAMQQANVSVSQHSAQTIRQPMMLAVG